MIRATSRLICMSKRVAESMQTVCRRAAEVSILLTCAEPNERNSCSQSAPSKQSSNYPGANLFAEARVQTPFWRVRASGGGRCALSLWPKTDSSAQTPNQFRLPRGLFTFVHARKQPRRSSNDLIPQLFLNLKLIEVAKKCFSSNYTICFSCITL